MRCTGCNEENDESNKRCARCGARLARSSRRRDLPPFHNSWTSSGLDDRAFRLAVWGLIPLAGLVLGPVAIIMGITALWRARSQAQERFTPAALTALVLGGAVMLANWLGVGLMVLGLMGREAP
jgi:hypothetical protein